MTLTTPNEIIVAVGSCCPSTEKDFIILLIGMGAIILILLAMLFTYRADK